MKAKEYADRYIAEGKTKESLCKVWSDMFIEFQSIAEIRHAQSDEAALSIFRELDAKWRAFARLANDNINPMGFRLVVEMKIPELYSLLVSMEKRG